MSTWQEIWDRRQRGESVGLEELLRLDGYDEGAGRCTVDDFREYARRVAERLDLVDGDSVYEVGCGAGALLVALRDARRLEVGGSDFAMPQVETARVALPDGEFELHDASETPPTRQYDAVVSNGVFHYFPDLDAAAQVLERMVAKARRVVAVLDVPDVALREQSEARRRAMRPPGEYDRLYAHLSHLSYSRDWFREQAARLGWACADEPSFVPKYPNAEFRFSVILWPGLTR